ncbi:MAG: hypothetical protein ACP5GX_05690, partial [Anaerolineae bacterium]
MSSKVMRVMALLLLLVTLVIGCTPTPTPTPTETPTEESTEEPTEAPTEEMPEGLEGMKAAYIFPGVVNDGSYNTQGYEAMLATQAALG